MQEASSAWRGLTGRLAAMLLVWVICLPGAAVLAELLRRNYDFRLPLPIEAELVFLVAIAVSACVFSSWVLTRSVGWAIAFMGLTALANALSPGREAKLQLTWLCVGTALGAIVGLIAAPPRSVAIVGAKRDESLEPSPAATTPKSSGSHGQLGRQARLATALALCVVAAMFLRYGLRVVTQARITKAVVRSHGSTIYDDPSTPTLLFKWLDLVPHGNEYQCLSSVALGSAAGNDDLAELGTIGLRSLPDLRALRLDRSQVNDDGLTIVADLPLLERLTLGTATTDAGLVHVKNLLALQHLDLTRTRITGRGLSHAGQLPALLYLALAFTQVADEDLAQIKGLPQLVCLDLSGTPVTDAGLTHLKELPSLATLLLVNTRITDAGLQRLADCRRLKWLFVQDTGVTLSGVQVLQTARPEILVVR